MSTDEPAVEMSPPSRNTVAPASEHTEMAVIPVVSEDITVHKRTVEVGRVRIQTTIEEREEIVDEPLARKRVSVEVVPIEEFVEGPPPIARQQGDIYIVPVLEERLVVEKRLFLKEELHIRSEQETFHEPQSVVLRRTEVTVERSDPRSSNRDAESAPGTTVA